MFSRLFKTKPFSISVGFLMSALPLVSGQQHDQSQNGRDLALTLFGGSLGIVCLFICIAKKCVENDERMLAQTEADIETGNNISHEDEIAAQPYIERGGNIQDDDGENGMSYRRLND